MGVLPFVPMILLTVISIWFFWPIVVDPIASRLNPNRRILRRDPERVADSLFESWSTKES